MKTEPAALIAYFGAFLGRGGEICLSVVFTLWIADFFGDSPEEQATVKAIAQPLYTVGIASGIVIAFAVNIVSDKVSFAYSLGIPSFLTAMGFIGIGFCRAPNSLATYFTSTIATGFVMTVDSVSSILNAKTIKPEFRGTLNGVYMFFSTLGILTFSKLGTVMLDAGRSVPFFVFGVGFILYGIAVILLKQFRIFNR